ATFRILAKSNPITARKSFYGNYGGPGNKGGPPQDEMDELFRRHDIVYYLSRAKGTMRVADEELISGLQSCNPAKLDEDGKEYRERAIGFFQS
ncbi:MAG: hypothetical protein GWO24_27390, partial [Akkermansiaceae bacterium]|nr:hypothetical protein [Akkermansiaceae bacterium]